MSNYNQERGFVTLPKTKVSVVKKAIVEAYNTEVELTYNLAVKLWENKTRFKATAGESTYEETCELAQKIIGYNPRITGRSLAHEEAIDRFLDSRGSKPKKKDYPRVSSRGDVELSFNENTLSITGNILEWDTDRNNHQVENAHTSQVYEAMIKALDSLSYNKNTGGYFEEWDEYSETWSVVKTWG